MKGWNNEKIKEQLQLHKKQNKDDRYNHLCREFNSLYYCWELEKYTIKLKKQLDNIKFYIEQSNIKDMLWGKEILKIIGDEK